MPNSILYMFDNVNVGTFTVLFYVDMEIFQSGFGDAINYFPAYHFWKMGENFVVISEWTFADTEGLLSLWEIEAKYFFCFVCTFQARASFYCSFSLSLGKYKKNPNVEWVEAAVVCSRKVQWKKWQTFFLLLSLCWRLSELVTRAMSEKTCLKSNYKIVLYKKTEYEVTDTVGFTYIPSLFHASKYFAEGIPFLYS